MQQNINLYLHEFKKQKHWLDATAMVQLAGSLAVVLMLATGAEYWWLSSQHTSLALLQQQQAEAVQATADLRTSFGSQEQDQALLDDIARLEAALSSKQALLDFMHGRHLGNGGGFSQHLTDLSHYHLAGLSVQQVMLENGGSKVQLKGDVLKPELVPQYLQNLRQGSAYTGKIFQTLAIKEKSLAAVATSVVTNGNANAEQAKQTDARNGPSGVWAFTVETESALAAAVESAGQATP
jgi:hypothetical protein